MVATSATIPAAAWEAWLEQLSPAALRAVLAQAIVRGSSDAIPARYHDATIELATQAAQLVGVQDATLRAKPDAPVFAQTPDGRLFYSAGGPKYRLVPPGDTAASLGFDPASVVPVELLALPQDGAWATGSTSASAFAEVGKIVAASGDVSAAYRFAATWRDRVASAA